jgi:hypothetical protein
MLIDFMAIWIFLRTFGILYDYWVHFVIIWYIFSGFGIMYQDQSGNPGRACFESGELNFAKNVNLGSSSVTSEACHTNVKGKAFFGRFGSNQVPKKCP